MQSVFKEISAQQQDWSNPVGKKYKLMSYHYDIVWYAYLDANQQRAKQDKTATSKH